MWGYRLNNLLDRSHENLASDSQIPYLEIDIKQFGLHKRQHAATLIGVHHKQLAATSLRDS